MAESECDLEGFLSELERYPRSELIPDELESSRSRLSKALFVSFSPQPWESAVPGCSEVSNR